METEPKNDASSRTAGFPKGWRQVSGGAAVHQRFEFDSYSQTSGFLDELAKLSEKTGIYPDLSFAKTYANVTIPCGGGDSEDTAESDFAIQTEALVGERGS